MIPSIHLFFLELGWRDGSLLVRFRNTTKFRTAYGGSGASASLVAVYPNYFWGEPLRKKEKARGKTPDPKSITDCSIISGSRGTSAESLVRICPMEQSYEMLIVESIAWFSQDANSTGNESKSSKTNWIVDITHLIGFEADGSSEYYTFENYDIIEHQYSVIWSGFPWISASFKSSYCFVTPGWKLSKQLRGCT